LGIRFPKGSGKLGARASWGLGQAGGAGKLGARVRAALEARPELTATIAPLLSAAATMKREIERLDRVVMARAKAAPACRAVDERAGRRGGDRAGLRRHHRDPRPGLPSRARWAPIWG